MALKLKKWCLKGFEKFSSDLYRVKDMTLVYADGSTFHKSGVWLNLKDGDYSFDAGITDVTGSFKATPKADLEMSNYIRLRLKKRIICPDDVYDMPEEIERRQRRKWARQFNPRPTRYGQYPGSAYFYRS